MKIIFLRILLVAFILALWEYASDRYVPAFFISSPTEIGSSFWGSVLDGDIFFHASITAIEAIGGFILGASLGFLVGLILGRQELLAKVLDPFITAFYSLPKVALAPLFILWFGIGLDMKIILAATIVFFLVFLNTYTGVRSVSRELLAILRLMGAKEHQLITKVVIPAALSWVFTGLRLSVPYALIGAIVGEIIASNRGLGFMLSDAAGQFDTAGVFSALLAIVALALLLNVIVKQLEKRLMPWKTSEDSREITV
jgi:NitT/TauT family transport system permease protein